MLVNTMNFIRWSDILQNPGLPDVPYTYWRDRTRCGYMPIFLPGEPTGFYINTPNGLNYPLDVSGDLRIQLLRAKDNLVVDEDFTPVRKHPLPESTEEEPRFNLYGEFVNPLVGDGIYYLRIIVGGTGEIKLNSNYINVRNDQQRLYETTTYCRFAHDRTRDFIRYHDIPNFYQQIRLNIGLIAEQNEDEAEIYPEATTASTNMLESVERKAMKFESYYFDNASHDAAASMIKHEYLELNGKRYKFKTVYKRNDTLMSKLSKGEFEVYDESYATINRC